MFKGKTVIIGVSAGIAAFKTVELVSMLVKTGADVRVIMTENAINFINPITFETLTGNKCFVHTFDRNFSFNVEHVDLAKQADVICIAPATADILAMLSNGFARDMLTSIVLASDAKKILVPSMNTGMYENPITQDNLAKLKNYGFKVMEPASGWLACRTVGKGKMPEPEEIFSMIEFELTEKKDMCGKKVIVTAGATREDLDPVRFISNRSTGKMGVAVAKAAYMRGAEVTLIKAFTEIEVPKYLKVVDVRSADDMLEEVKKRYEKADIIIKAAAVSDYKPASVSDQKIKKSSDDLNIELQKNVDILEYIGKHKRKNQFVCGFSMETRDLIENSKQKLKKKNADMIIANNLKDEGSGFGTDTNSVTVITEDGCEPLSLLSKEDVAQKILDRITERFPK